MISFTSGASTSTQATNIGYGMGGGEYSLYSTLENPSNINTALPNSNYGAGFSGTGSVEVSGFEGIFDRFDTLKNKGVGLANSDVSAFEDSYSKGRIGAMIKGVVPVLVKDIDYGQFYINYAFANGVSSRAIKTNYAAGGLLPDVQLAFDTSYIKKKELAFGFARDLTNSLVAETFGENVKLSYGVKAKLQDIGSNKHVFNFNNELNNSNSSKDGFQDVIDSLDSKIDTKSHFTADIGAKLKGSYWTIGTAVMNVLPVDIDYNVVNDGGLTNEYASSFTIKPYGLLDAAVHTKDKNWRASTYVETNSHKSILNLVEQNAGAGISYASDIFYIPDVRLGLNKNLTGSELTQYTAGLTLGFVNFDVALSKFDIDSDNYSDFAGSASLSIELEL